MKKVTKGKDAPGTAKKGLDKKNAKPAKGKPVAGAKSAKAALPMKAKMTMKSGRGK